MCMKIRNEPVGFPLEFPNLSLIQVLFSYQVYEIEDCFQFLKDELIFILYNFDHVRDDYDDENIIFGFHCFITRNHKHH